jgi:uncharacterized membrane protein
MNAQDIHLLTNHIPVFGLFFGLALWILGLVRMEEKYTRLGLVVLMITTLLSIVAFRSGHPAHEIVEDLPGSSHKMIHEHRDAAKWGYYMMLPLGILALGIYLQLRWVAIQTKWIQWIIVVFGLFTFAAMARASHLGGEIRRPELRGEAPGAKGEEHKEQEKEEEEKPKENAPPAKP